MNLQVHLGLAVKPFDIALKLALIGTNGLAETLIVLKDGSEAEGKNGRVLKAVGDNSGVIDSRLLIQCFIGVVLAHNNGQVAGGVKENLIATDSKYGFEWNWFAMAG
jgi:hypothetical protein